MCQDTRQGCIRPDLREFDGEVNSPEEELIPLEQEECVGKSPADRSNLPV